MQICTEGAENIFNLLNSHYQELTLNIVVVYIWKQSALEEGKELKPELKERTMTVSKLTEGFELT
jgi:hypothetical protein